MWLWALDLAVGVSDARACRAVLVRFLKVTEAAVVAGLRRRQYGRSHGTRLADALIAASADAVGGTLVTLNQRHFPMLANLLIPYRKPSP